MNVPVENRIGDEGEGWTYAKYLLTFERGNAYAPGPKRAAARRAQIAADGNALSGRPLVEDPDFARKLADLEIQIEALDFTELRIFSQAGVGPVGRRRCRR